MRNLEHDRVLSRCTLFITTATSMYCTCHMTQVIRSCDTASALHVAPGHGKVES